MLLKNKLRSFSPRLLSCGLPDGNATAYHEAAAASGCDESSCRRAARSPPCVWLRSTAQELPLLGIRDKCRSLIALIGSHRRRQGQVAAAASEFGYDPMNYTLNFEDDRSRELDEEFSVRLPAPPDRFLPAKLPREIVVACRRSFYP